MTARRYAAAPGLIALCAAFVLGATTLAGAQSAGAQSDNAQAGASPVSLTVEEAVARALANQPSIQQAQSSLEAARARVGEAESTYWPALSATGSWTHIEPDQSVAVVLPGLGSFSLVVPVDNYDVRLGVSQVITQFGRRVAQVKVAESGVSSARIGVEQAKTAVAYGTAQLFYGVLFLQQQAAALDSQYANLEEHLRVIEVREQTGSASRLEVLSTQVRMAALKGQQTDTRTQLARQLFALSQMIGVPLGTKIELDGTLQPGDAAGDPDALVAQALERRTEVRQAAEAQRAAELTARLTLDSAFPTLSARGAVGWRNGLEPTPTDMTFNWSAGVNLNVPLFQGFLAAHSLEEMKSRVDAASAATQAARLSVTTQVVQAWQDRQGARDQVAITAGALDQARQMVNVAKVQYDIGVITNLEYLDAQTALETASLTNLG
ncbi:MAG TPA: TolC family protein, partial [Spirochaetia bacterium]|nr:TolC family protein [Spirochaetia bacterium]